MDTIADALAAYGHFISIFLAFSCLTAELIFYRPSMPMTVVRHLRRIDAGYGLAAVAILATGFIRLTLIGKGHDYYLHNGMFWIKMAMVAAIVALSVVPTSHFLRLRRKTTTDSVIVALPSYRRIRAFLWTEAVLLALIPFFATLMARGIGLR
jgi:putative membrane protein